MYSFKHSYVFFSGCRRYQSFGSLSWRFYRQVVHCICCSFGTGSDTPCVYCLFMQQEKGWKRVSYVWFRASSFTLIFFRLFIFSLFTFFLFLSTPFIRITLLSLTRSLFPTTPWGFHERCSLLSTKRNVVRI